MTEIKIPYKVLPNPEPITALQSALDKLNDDSSKMTHLEPRQVKALRDYIGELETENREPTDTERELFARLWGLTGFHASMIGIWNDKEQMMQQRIDELERENEELKVEIELSSLDGPL